MDEMNKSIYNSLTESKSQDLQQASRRIRDADFADEMIRLTRSQILQQAGSAAIAQANQLPQIALSLLH